MLPALAGGVVLSTIIVPLLVKVFISFGVGFVTYTGLSAAMDTAFDLISTQLNAAPVELVQMLGLMKVDVYISMIFSAYTAKLVIGGMTSAGALSKINFKGIGVA